MRDLERIGAKIRRLYLSLRGLLAIILIVVAFLTGQFEIPIAKESALVAATLIMVSILLEIHKEVTSASPNRRFPRFHDAALEFRSKVEELAQRKGRVDIKWLGMGMDYGAPMLDDIISCLKSESFDIKVALNICMLDPEWEHLPAINDTWSHKGRSAIQSLSSLYDRLTGDDQRLQVTLDLHLYRHMPNWHGFMIDDRYLYLSKCSWDGERLLGGENEYELIDKTESDGSRREIECFMGWFNYCSKDSLNLSEIKLMKGE
jgi:hypothetical protein